MKKLFILSLASLGFVACGERADYIVLSGKIDSYNGLPLKITGGDFKSDLHINQDGTFRDTLKVDTNYFYYTIGNPMYGVQVPVYLEKGKETAVNINLNSNPIAATFTGANVDINNYLQKKNALYFQVQNGLEKTFAQKPEDFKKSIIAIGQQYLNLLNGEKELSKKFLTTEAKAINYELLYMKSLYEGAHQELTGEEVKLPKEIADELARVDYDLSQDFDIYGYYKALVISNFYEKYQSAKENENPWDKVIKHFDTIKSENIKKSLSRSLISGISVANTPENNKKLAEIVKANVKDAEGVAEINKRLANLERLKDGNPFPAFEAQDIQGNTVSSESLKGKLVYIDIWATWCLPCRKEIPALKALQEEYKDKDITFVSLSVDDDKEAWKNAVTTEKLTGVQLHKNVQMSPDFAENYDLTGIPRFILVSKDGKLISINAPRPSEAKIKELINANL